MASGAQLERQQADAVTAAMNIGELKKLRVAPEDKEILARNLVDRAHEAFQMQGEAAFDCPRHHTAHHEAGHAITGRVLFGWTADKVEVWPVEKFGRTGWSGMNS